MNDDEIGAWYDADPAHRDPVGPAHRLPPTATTRRFGPIVVSRSSSRRRAALRWEGWFTLIWASLRRPTDEGGED